MSGFLTDRIEDRISKLFGGYDVIPRSRDLTETSNGSSRKRPKVPAESFSLYCVPPQPIDLKLPHV